MQKFETDFGQPTKFEKSLYRLLGNLENSNASVLAVITFAERAENLEGVYRLIDAEKVLVLVSDMKQYSASEYERGYERFDLLNSANGASATTYDVQQIRNLLIELQADLLAASTPGGIPVRVAKLDIVYLLEGGLIYGDLPEDIRVLLDEIKVEVFSCNNFIESKFSMS